jgi:hypothetical protein
MQIVNKLSLLKISGWCFYICKTHQKVFTLEKHNPSLPGEFTQGVYFCRKVFVKFFYCRMMSTCSRVFQYDSAEGSDFSDLYWVLPLLY